VISALRTQADSIVEWMTGAARATTALSLMRAVIGFASLALYLRHYTDRGLFFGPDGVYGQQGISDYAASIGTFSLYSASSSPVVFELIFHTGIVMALLVMLGIGGRAVLAAHYVLLWSLYMANPSFMDGGDALTATAIPFLLLTRCHSSFAVRRRGRERAESGAVAVCNNTGLLLLAVQVCIVYLMAGLYKVQGDLWQDGTALYYVLNVPEFFLPGVTPLLMQSDWLPVLGGYATVLVSVFFPALIVFRGGRIVAVTAMLVFHLAIAVLMGLTSFALVMAAYDMLFVDGHIERFRFHVRKLIGVWLPRPDPDARGGA
jgi:hypothetical protein